MVKTVIVNLGFGNLYGLNQALIHADFNPIISSNPEEVKDAKCVVLPGVGSFSNGITKLKETGWIQFLEKWVEEDKPLLGICLGMQMLFEKSYEFGEHQGLGVFRGNVIKINNQGNCKVPKIGWFNLEVKKEENLLGLSNKQRMYFVHSYGAQCNEDTYTSAHVQYNEKKYIAAIKKNAVWGAQFHPENSNTNGIKYLKSFNNFVKSHES